MKYNLRYRKSRVIYTTKYNALSTTLLKTIISLTRKCNTCQKTKRLNAKYFLKQGRGYKHICLQCQQIKEETQHTPLLFDNISLPPPPEMIIDMNLYYPFKIPEDQIPMFQIEENFQS